MDNIPWSYYIDILLFRRKKFVSQREIGVALIENQPTH